MENKIEKIYVNYSEYCYFEYISKREGLNYFFDLYEAQYRSPNINLKQFFSDVKTQLDTTHIEEIKIHEEKIDDYNRVDVMIDDEFLMIESNKLKSINKYML